MPLTDLLESRFCADKNYDSYTTIPQIIKLYFAVGENKVKVVLLAETEVLYFLIFK